MLRGTPPTSSCEWKGIVVSQNGNMYWMLTIAKSLVLAALFTFPGTHAVEVCGGGTGTRRLSTVPQVPWLSRGAPNQVCMAAHLGS